MTWITVSDAMELVGRSRTQIYDWAARGRVRARRNADNVLVIDALHLLEIEPTVLRGRRPGTARPKATRGAPSLN